MANRAPVFAATWAALHRILAAADWPATDGQTGPVVVAYSTWGPTGEPLEGVLVRTLTESSDDEWGPVGDQPTTRDQTFSTVIEVGTSLPARTPEQAAARLDELVGVVYREIRKAAKPPHPPEFIDPVSTEDRFLWWSIELDAAVVGTLPSNTTGGYARLIVTTRARI